MSDDDLSDDEREWILEQAEKSPPLVLILREILSEIYGHTMTDDEWRDWIRRVI